MKKWLILLLVCQSLYSCVAHGTQQESLPVVKNNYVDPYIFIDEGQQLLKEGDLVVRLNQDPVSQFIKNFSRQDKSYSHAGIVLFENGYPYIFHMVNGGENPDEKLRKDSLARYCSPRKNSAYGIFRYDLKASETNRLKSILHQWLTRAVRFDNTFDLTTNDKMYCSEMVSKALKIATSNRIVIQTTEPTLVEAKCLSMYMHLPFAYTSRLKVISIDNLYIHPSCRLIKEYNYKTY